LNILVLQPQTQTRLAESFGIVWDPRPWFNVTWTREGSRALPHNVTKRWDAIWIFR